MDTNNPSTYQLFHGDCLEVMKGLEAGSVDAIVCDPPYGTTACAWDSVIPFAPMWECIKRVIKTRGAVVLFGGQPFTSALVMSNPKWFKYTLVWKKTMPLGFFHAKNKPLNAHEDICIFSNGSVAHAALTDNRMPYNPQMENGKPYTRLRRPGNRGTEHGFDRPSHREYLLENNGERYPGSVIEFGKGNGETLHPTQKPVALTAYLVKTYTNPGQTVLDFTMGSGSTGAACLETGRNFIGIEMDAEYFQVASRRLETIHGRLHGLARKANDTNDTNDDLPLFRVR